VRDVTERYALPFAAWEMRLFLDTHPRDRRAIAAYWQLCSQSPCSGSYACLPQKEYSCDRWCWVDDPWPWEAAANPSAACAKGVQ